MWRARPRWRASAAAPRAGRLVLELHRPVRPVLGGTALLDDDLAVRVRVAGLERPALRVAGAVPLGLALVVAAGVALGADAALRDRGLDLAPALLARVPLDRALHEDLRAVAADLLRGVEPAEHRRFPPVVPRRRRRPPGAPALSPVRSPTPIPARCR